MITKDSNIHRPFRNDSTKHDTARSRTFLNDYTTILKVFLNQILEILASQNGILIIDIWNSALEIRNLVNVCLKTSEQLQTLQSLVSALPKSIELNRSIEFG